MNKLFLILLAILFSTVLGNAQELEFTINIDRQQAPNVPKNLTDDLKTNFTNFINNRKWTNDQFAPQERIKCNLLLTLSESSTVGNYSSIAQFQFVRPVYGATYESIVMTFIDKNFNFEFSQSQSLDYNENVYISNIVSLLSFYANIALAFDYDSFSKLGGNPYVEKSFALANIAQSSNPGKNGWEANEFNNRMALIVNLNNQQFIPFREGLYTYHREAMDKFLENPDVARKKIMEVLKKIRITRQAVSVSILTSSFFLAKKLEIVQVFSKAPPEMKNEVVNLLREIDAVNAETYAAILKN